MIALFAASVMFLVADQAALSGPTMSFKECLKTASNQATKDKVASNAYEGYARNACSAQISGCGTRWWGLRSRMAPSAPMRRRTPT